MINNFKKILPLLTFESEDDFYYLQILQRKKENPQLGSNSRVIKNYYIKSVKQLNAYKDEIITLCEVFNARASIRLNKRSWRKVALKNMVNVANTIHNGEFNFVRKSYDRACGLGHNDKNKKWILDIDGEFPIKYQNKLDTYLYNIEPKGNKIIEYIPSKNGIHLITSPFNTSNFNLDFEKIEIHKDNPTNLYIP